MYVDAVQLFCQQELDSNVYHSVLHLEKKNTLTFLLLDNVASIRPAIIKSTTFNVAPGFHSSPLILLTFLSVELDNLIVWYEILVVFLIVILIYKKYFRHIYCS